MTSEEIIKKYRLGPDSRVKFKDDPQQYWIKNISPNRKEVFIHINGAQTYRKLIKNIVQVGNEKLEKNKNLKNIIKEVIHSKTCHCGCGGSCKASIKEEKSSTPKPALKKRSQPKTHNSALNEGLLAKMSSEDRELIKEKFSGFLEEAGCKVTDWSEGEVLVQMPKPDEDLNFRIRIKKKKGGSPNSI